MIVGVPKEIKNNEYRVGLVPSSVRELVENGHEVIIEHDAGLGIGIDDAAFEQSGHIRMDLGLDTAFLHSELALDERSLERVQDNNRQLIEFTMRIEKYCNVSSRLLWSDDDSTLAQKLIERLQKLQ